MRKQIRRIYSSINSIPINNFNNSIKQIYTIKHTAIPYIRFIQCTIISLATFFFVGCSTDILQPNFYQSKPPTHSREYYMAAADRSLKQAELSQYPYSLEHRLEAATNLVKADQLNESAIVLRELLNQEPNMDPDLRRVLFEARLALMKEEPKRAITLIRDMKNSVSKLTGGMKDPSLIESKKIALLLPSQGAHAKAAKTIQEGFLAAYYNTVSKKTGPNRSVQIYDTSGEGGVVAAYQRALAENAEMIVGPLTKTEVQVMANMTLEIPVLALNTIHESRHLPNKLYQFGLIPEDEVFAVARHARQQGQSRALIIAPQNEWGQRMVKAFRHYFESQKGRVVATVMVTPSQDLGNKLKAALQANHANGRSNIDMIFLAANPDLGRQIKPYLNSHAANLPIYATATIYSGTPSANRDHDLEGIRFCDMPWTLTNAPSLNENQKALSLAPKTLNDSPRYYALGIDAYSLASQLSDRSIPLRGLHGVTGDLQIDNQQHIQRKLVCARFEQGIPVPD